MDLIRWLNVDYEEQTHSSANELAPAKVQTKDLRHLQDVAAVSAGKGAATRVDVGSFGMAVRPRKDFARSLAVESLWSCPTSPQEPGVGS